MWRPCREEQNTAFDRLVLMIDLGDRSQPERRAALLRERGRGGVGVHGEWNSATDKERRRRKTSQFIQLFRIIIRHATVRFAGEIIRRSRAAVDRPSQPLTVRSLHEKDDAGTVLEDFRMIRYTAFILLYLLEISSWQTRISVTFAPLELNIFYDYDGKMWTLYSIYITPALIFLYPRQQNHCAKRRRQRVTLLFVQWLGIAHFNSLNFTV